MRPGEETGAGLAPACWPDRKPVRPVVARHSSAASGLNLQTGTRCVPQPGLESYGWSGRCTPVELGQPRRSSNCVLVVDTKSGDEFELSVPSEGALDAFHHPFAYAAKTETGALTVA